MGQQPLHGPVSRVPASRGFDIARMTGGGVHTRDRRRYPAFLTRDPERVRRGKSEEGGKIAVLDAAGQEVRCAVRRQVGKAETGCVDGGFVDRVARDRSRGRDPRAGAVETDQVDVLGAMVVMAHPGYDGKNVVDATSKQRVVVRIRERRGFARVLDDSLLLHGLVIRPEVTLLKEIGRDDGRAVVQKTSHGGADPTGFVEQAPLTRPVDPNDDGAVPLGVGGK